MNRMTKERLAHSSEYKIGDSNQELLTKLAEWRRNPSNKDLGDSESWMSMSLRVPDEPLGASGSEINHHA